MGDFLIVRRGGSAGASGGLANYIYTGDSVIEETDSNIYIKLLTSGIFKLKSDAIIDVFLVGGGASGAAGDGYKGAGGGAGYTTTVLGVIVTAGEEYPVIIGAGGESVSTNGSYGKSGGDTTAFSQTAGGGEADTVYYTRGGNGGSGGAGYDGTTGGTDGGNGTGSSNYKGSGQGTTTREFGENNGTLYATGGDAGGYNSTPMDGMNNTGDGGDGSVKGVASGAGGSGIVVIRGVK